MDLATQLVGNIKKQSSIAALDTTVRQAKVLELRRNGLTYEQIYLALVNMFGSNMLPDGYSDKSARDDLDKAVKAFQTDLFEDTQTIVMLELQRLDQMFLVAYGMALNGDMKAMDRALKIMERRAALVGLDKPKEVKISDWRSEIIELMKSGKISFEQVRNELGDSIAIDLARQGNISIPESGDFVEAEFNEPIELMAASSSS